MSNKYNQYQLVRTGRDVPTTHSCIKVLLLVDEIDVRPGNLRVFCKIRTDEKHLIDRTIFCDELPISRL